MIRWVVRLFFLVVLGFGLLLGVVYPWAADDATGYEIGRMQVYDPQSGFATADVSLDPSEGQVRVVVEVVTGPAGDGRDGAVELEMTVSREGRTELFQILTLADAEPRLMSPQTEERLYRLEAGTLHFIRSEPYVFEVEPRAGEETIRSVEVVLFGGFVEIDESVPPIGYGLIAIGFVGLVASFRRRRENPNSQPPKWGR